MANFKGDGGMIFLMFFGLILVATLIIPIADQVFVETNTFTNTNETVTIPAVNETLDLGGRTLLTSVSVVNSTGFEVDGMFLQTGFTNGGLRSVQLTINQTASAEAGNSGNVSYTYEPDGYVSGGTASITLLIVLFAALAGLVFVVVALFGNDSFKKLIGRK
ncbi:hypothetical protein LCGC14_0439550 [marine sediment metagenome]|uniref:Uncharacterized protein n=1 Tax=marine sediment metagenome TaxID=412755 RepID=A0A0F9T473_9ZZZZ